MIRPLGRGWPTFDPAVLRAHWTTRQDGTCFGESCLAHHALQAGWGSERKAESKPSAAGATRSGLGFGLGFGLGGFGLPNVKTLRQSSFMLTTTQPLLLASS
jgi:hypothetical protein